MDSVANIGYWQGINLVKLRNLAERQDNMLLFIFISSLPWSKIQNRTTL